MRTFLAAAISVSLSFAAAARAAPAPATTPASALPAGPMVGPGVGSVDLLVTQGLQAYNAGHYEAARDAFLKSLRAKPDNGPLYLSLARSYLQTHQVAMACWTYRVFLKANPTSTDREKAQAELGNCALQMKALTPVPADPGLAFVNQRAAFQEAAEAGKLLGPGSASAVLEQMIALGYAAPDLKDMAAKLQAAAQTKAEGDHQRAVARTLTDPAQLREGAQLFRLAIDVGATDGTFAPRAKFLDALADLQAHDWASAEKGFLSAMGTGDDALSHFYAGVAAYRAGHHQRALEMLQKALPNDPRTQLLQVDAAIARDPAQGSKALEKLLFALHFKGS